MDQTETIEVNGDQVTKTVTVEPVVETTSKDDFIEQKQQELQTLQDSLDITNQQAQCITDKMALIQCQLDKLESSTLKKAKK